MADCTGDTGTTQKLDIHPVQLWNGKSGAFLYTVEAELIVDGNCADRMELTTGLKKYRLIVRKDKIAVIIHSQKWYTF